MRRTLFATSLAFSFLISASAFAQMIVENPAKPDDPRAGRVVTLKEVMRIEDKGEDFYLKSVYGLAVSRDGSVFLQDDQKQLLRFDSNGRFIRDLLKLGQGPGELTGLMSFLVADNQVNLFGNPRKVVILDYEGHLVQEVPLDKAGRYIDCFFLKYREGKIAQSAIFKRFVFSGGFVYFDDKTGDDLVVIRKCRLIGL